MGHQIWYPDLKNHERENQTIQGRATKMIASLGHLSYSERLDILILPTLCYRRRRCDLIQVFKITKNIDKLEFGFFFQFDNGITRT